MVLVRAELYFLFFLAFGRTSVSIINSSNVVFSDLLFSCQDLKSKSNENNFCHIVNWPYANAYYKYNYSSYKKDTPVDISIQNDIASYFYSTYEKKGKSSSNMCKDAMKRYSCAQTFPNCPQSNLFSSGANYYLPCQVQCEQMKLLCEMDISCSSLPVKNCMLTLPANKFVLSVDQGPYKPLFVLYPIIFAFWMVLLIVWFIASFIWYPYNSLYICKFLILLPAMKIVTLVFAVPMWSGCVQQLLCDTGLAIAYLNFQLIFEACKNLFSPFSSYYTVLIFTI